MVFFFFFFFLFLSSKTDWSTSKVLNRSIDRVAHESELWSDFNKSEMKIRERQRKTIEKKRNEVNRKQNEEKSRKKYPPK